MHFVLRFYTFSMIFCAFELCSAILLIFQSFSALLHLVLGFYIFSLDFPQFFTFSSKFPHFLNYFCSFTYSPSEFVCFLNSLGGFTHFPIILYFFVFYNFFFITLNLLNTSTWINFILTQLNFTRNLVYRSGWSQILTLIRINLWNCALYPTISVKSHNHPVPSHLLYGSFQLFLQLKPFFHSCWLS